MAKSELKLPALDPSTVESPPELSYPPPLEEHNAGVRRHPLGAATGLKNMGVNLTYLDPGATSSMRHWHLTQDEFIYILEGEVTLVTDGGEQILGPGMACGFPCASGDGHKLVNRSASQVVMLEAGDRSPGDAASYPDDDVSAGEIDGEWVFMNKKGERL